MMQCMATPHDYMMARQVFVQQGKIAERTYSEYLFSFLPWYWMISSSGLLSSVPTLCIV